MQKFYLIILSILLVLSCSVRKHETNNSKRHILYESFGQSGGYEYLINNRFFNKIVDSIKYKTKINDNDWNLLISKIDKINIYNLSKLKSPSNERAGDGAWYTKISIGISDTIYNTPYYDDGNPNIELKELDRTINKTIKKYLKKLPKKALKRYQPYANEFIDQKPIFSKRYKNLNEYVYSKITQKTKNKSIRAFTHFIINEKGEVSELKIRCNDSIIQKKLLKVLRSMPKWKAGKHNGIKVKTFQTNNFKF